MTDHDTQLTRSRRTLQAARVLLSAGFAEEAVSRSYFAAFFAAQIALQQVNVARVKHSAVISGFVRFVAREGGFDKETTRLLRSLFEHRNEADYGSGDVSSEAARRAIADAERFVDAVEAWLSTRETEA